ncbi:hypothetical protein B0J14DRAFT_351829 [Halenospora varia]|nr:hypothetical protein B0J14DRAFT_351829 [Halenospora varia]
MKTGTFAFFVVPKRNKRKTASEVERRNFQARKNALLESISSNSPSSSASVAQIQHMLYPIRIKQHHHQASQIFIPKITFTTSVYYHLNPRLIFMSSSRIFLPGDRVIHIEVPRARRIAGSSNLRAQTHEQGVTAEGTNTESIDRVGGTHDDDHLGRGRDSGSEIRQVPPSQPLRIPSHTPNLSESGAYGIIAPINRGVSIPTCRRDNSTTDPDLNVYQRRAQVSGQSPPPQARDIPRRNDEHAAIHKDPFPRRHATRDARTQTELEWHQLSTSGRERRLRCPLYDEMFLRPDFDPTSTSVERDRLSTKYHSF